MDHPALSFGDGHYTESVTLFNTQLPPDDLIKQSVDRLEIPDENIIPHQPESGFLTSTSLNAANHQVPNNDQIGQKLRGKLKGMLSNKENIPRKERENSFENPKGPLRSFGEAPTLTKVHQPFTSQDFSKKPPVNASFHSLRPPSGAPDSFSMSFTQENRRPEKEKSADSNRRSLQPLTEQVFERNQSRGNLKLDVETSNLSNSMSYPDGSATTDTTKSLPFKQADYMNYPRSSQDFENSKLESKENKRPEKPLRRKTPMKVEISLALGPETAKAEQSQRQEEVRVSSRKEEQGEKRQSAWNSSSRHSDQEEPAFRPLSKEKTLSNTGSVGRTSVEQQEAPGNKRESYRKKPMYDIIDPAPQSTTMSGQQNEEKETPQAKTVYERLFEMNKSRRGFQKNTSVPALNDSESFQDNKQSSFAVKNDPSSSFFIKNNYSFQPKLESKSKNIKRGEKVEDLLYKDAIRRQNKSLENISFQAPTPSNYTLRQSNKLIAKKFIREFEDEANSFFGTEQEHKFNKQQLIELLKGMKFIKGYQGTSAHAFHEKILIDTFWNILKGDKYSGVNERNLLLFLLAIMGLHCELPGYTPKATTTVTPSVSDKATLPLQLSKAESNNGNTEINPSEKRESMWKKRQEAELAEAIKNSVQEEQQQQKEAPVVIEPVQDLPIGSNNAALHVKNKLSATSDQSDISLGISNILAQKLSFQSEHAKQLESMPELPESEAEQCEISLGTFDDDENINFSEEETQCIAQTYDVFYSNRLHASKSLSKKMSQSYLDSSFEPEILEYSRQLASNYREKQLQNLEEIIIDLKEAVPADRRVTHADLLIYKGLSTRNKLSQQREKSLEKQLEGCTFRPNLTATRTPGRKTIKFDKQEKELPYQSRGEHLYSIAKNKHKSDHSASEIEYQKNYENYTFKPNVEKSARSQSRPKNKSSNVSKDFEKSVERMKRGREQRENVRMATENRARGLDDKSSQFKFTLEKTDPKQKNMISFARKPQAGSSNTEDRAKENRKQNSMSFTNAKKADSSFGSFDTRENHQNYGLSKEEEQLYQAHLQNNHKVLTEDDHSDNMNKTLNQTYQTVALDTEEHITHVNKTSERTPLLFIDVNFGGDKSERIGVYEGDTAEGLAAQFALKNNLNDHLKAKLMMLLQSHMSGILSKIEEEMPSTQSEIHRVPPSHSVYNKFR